MASIVKPEHCNKEIDQDRVKDTVEHFERFGYIMFPQQRKIYNSIANYHTSSRDVLEAGCGNGLGAAIMCQKGNCGIHATDKLSSNVEFAKNLYPWIPFSTWDINEPWRTKKIDFDVVVCVETFEHVADPQTALNNLIGAAKDKVIISTPNGTKKYRPPHNPYHVCEYTPEEMRDMIIAADYSDGFDPETGKPVVRKFKLKYLNYMTFQAIDLKDMRDPAVYVIEIES